ncbi:MAG TPA: glycine/sarcosine/betaine reductase selenoprotein B family protein [Candidatus Dormibacteraeota bacterium]
MVVDSFKFLPRSFRPHYEGRGAFPGEDGEVWTPFAKRLSDSKIALLSSAGLFVDGEQQPFDTEREKEHPEWGDPTWRSIDSATKLGAAHLHINTADIEADPEIALPRRMLAQLAAEGVVSAGAEHHYAVMGYQHRRLSEWRERTAPEIIAALRAEQVDGLILAPA